MSRIPDYLLDCVVYLYCSEAEASRGDNAGGSGFLVKIPCETHPGMVYVFAVTASHVVEQGATIVRLNSVDGQTSVIATTPGGWVKHPDGEDVAVCLLDFEGEAVKFNAVSEEQLLTKQLVAQHNVGPGDESYIVGRFFSHEGKQRNLPSVRFGNLAMMPLEPVYNEFRGLSQECFLVDARSLGGYSGAPAFVYIPPLTPRAYGGLETLETASFILLLGVVWGHFEEKVDDSEYARLNSGLVCVVPAWKLADLLHRPEVEQLRRAAEAKCSRARPGDCLISASRQRSRPPPATP